MHVQVLAAVGVYAIGCWLYENLLSSLLGIIWGTLRQLLWERRSLAERYGKWAVVTGATDGIGKGYAVHLARLGMNLVLISRSEEKLVRVTREIQQKYHVQIKWIVIDFSDDHRIFTHIRKQLCDVDVGILVNNVGMVAERLDYFECISEQETQHLLRVNIQSTLWMTHMILPQMKRVRRGLIINVSSATAYVPAPYNVMYSATKGFVHSLTLALQQELRGSGVECQLVAPLFVKTNLIENLDVSAFGGWLLPNGIQYSRWATFTIGKTEHTCGHWYHGIMVISFLVFRKFKKPNNVSCSRKDFSLKVFRLSSSTLYSINLGQ